MFRLIILLAIAAIVVVILGINRTPPPPVILDLPTLVATNEVPLRSPNARKEGRLYWTTSVNKQFSRLELAALSPQGAPEIITGDFTHPIKGKTETLAALGLNKRYKLIEQTPEYLLLISEPFEQITLYYTPSATDEYSGFYAATHLGLVNTE